jgi:hypothetical protein
VDPFALVLLGGVLAVALFVWLVGKYYPGSGLDQLGLKSAREIVETSEALEAEDLEQMLAAHNSRRRARGEPEVSAADYEHGVLQELHDERRRREQYLAEKELDEMLAVTNERRRKRGLPERTREQVRREFGGKASTER